MYNKELMNKVFIVMFGISIIGIDLTSKDPILPRLLSDMARNTLETAGGQ